MNPVFARDVLSDALPEQITTRDSRRLFHGRGHCFSGFEHVCVDWFAPAIVVTLFDDRGREWEQALTECLIEYFVDTRFDASLVPEGFSLYIQRRYQRSPMFEHVHGVPLVSLCAQRGELRFALTLTHQNIGFFLDIEPARMWLEKHCEGKNILNLFSYTCSFSVVATAAKAKGVVNMDLSSKSLSQGRESYRLSRLPLENIKFFANDILKSWSRIKRFGLYDIVIIDPPSFQKGSFVATKDYAKVLRRMNGLVNASGYVLCSLNAPEIEASSFKALVESHLEGFSFCEKLDANAHFPDAEPEKALKLFVYKKNENVE